MILTKKSCGKSFMSLRPAAFSIAANSSPDGSWAGLNAVTAFPVGPGLLAGIDAAQYDPVTVAVQERQRVRQIGPDIAERVEADEADPRKFETRRLLERVNPLSSASRAATIPADSRSSALSRSVARAAPPPKSWSWLVDDAAQLR